ncbi:MAG: histidine phosphatase family protein [Oscillospiraceae bacterium]|jgi:alpha-ribazole phosphatase|nr:histidine phosphatase family protein [Oscillospiraceae bacterium]
MKLILLRHAKTGGNLVKRYIGVTDEPLDPVGIEQANASIDESVARVYVSPMKRALETAAIRFPNAERVIVPDLAEMHFGDFEGRNADEMTDDLAYRAWVDANCEPAPPGAPESWDEYRARVCGAILTLIRAANAEGENSVVTVSHGGTIMAAMQRWARPEKRYYEWNPRHCSGYIVELDLENWDEESMFRNWSAL